MSQFALEQDVFELSRQELQEFIFEVMKWDDEPLPHNMSLDQALNSFIDAHLTPIKRRITDDQVQE